MPAFQIKQETKYLREKLAAHFSIEELKRIPAQVDHVVSELEVGVIEKEHSVSMKAFEEMKKTLLESGMTETRFNQTFKAPVKPTPKKRAARKKKTTA